MATKSFEKTGKQPVIFGEEKMIKEITEILKEKGVSSAEAFYDEEDEVFDLIVSAEERPQTLALIQVIMKEKQEKMLAEMSEEEKEELRKKNAGKNKLYENKAEKAEDAKNSGVSLLIVGFAGIVFLVLYAIGIIPLNLSPFGRMILLVVMGILFLSLVAFGFSAIKSWKKISVSAKEENNLTEEIQKWCSKELTKEKIEDGLYSASSDIREEEKYFMRIGRIKYFINHKFMNLDNAFVDEIAENVYQELFESE